MQNVINVFMIEPSTTQTEYRKMSEAAQTLMFWIAQANVSVADNDDDRAYCFGCARNWAAHIIAGGNL